MLKQHTRMMWPYDIDIPCTDKEFGKLQDNKVEKDSMHTIILVCKDGNNRWMEVGQE